MGFIAGRAEVLILASVSFGGGGLESMAASSHQESESFPDIAQSWEAGSREAGLGDDGDRCSIHRQRYRC